MGRPRCTYNIKERIPFYRFTPDHCSCPTAIDITPEEVESLRLKNIKDLDQIEAAKHMGVSQSTFQRVLSSAYKKVSVALVEQREIRVAPRKELPRKRI